MTSEPLAAAVAAVDWYHCLELAPGLVTPGHFDARATVTRVPLPASLAGRRCLDVGTWDGFWAFEMERRGAEEVLAIDIDDPDRWDWPPRARLDGSAVGGRAIVAGFKSQNRGFEVAHRALRSSVRRLDLSVHDLAAEDVGRFDFVFMGSLLLHLRDPVGALAALREVCSGEAVVADAIDLLPTLLRPRTPTARLEAVDRPWWWLPNAAGLERMARTAGFDVVERSGVYFLPLGPGHPRPRLQRPLRSLLSPEGRERLVVRARRGIPHAAFRLRPLA
jgi:tRNA (mo5U34)-methyltransferase